MVLTAIRTVVRSLRSDDVASGRRTVDEPEPEATTADLKAAVKEGVIEGLAEHDRRVQEDRSDEESTGSSRSLVKTLGGAALLGSLAYAGRKRMRDRKDRESQVNRDVPIDTSPDGGRTDEQGESRARGEDEPGESPTRTDDGPDYGSSDSERDPGRSAVGGDDAGGSR